MKNLSLNLHSFPRFKSNLKILIFLFLLFIGSFNNQHLWPFIPYDMYCKEKAEVRKNFWVKVITPSKVKFFRAELKVPAPRRFFFKANLLKFRELQKSDPEKLQYYLKQFHESVGRGREKNFKLELYEQTFIYKNEKLADESMELIGSYQ